MRKIVYLLAFILLLSFVGCSPPETATPKTVLFGKATGTSAIALTRVTDLNRKKIDLVGRIEIRKDGTFKQTFESLEPHLYEINFPNGKKVQFVIDGTETIEFAGDANSPDEFRVSGSDTNEKFLAYERFRKESLERLVKSVRAKIKALPKKEGEEWVKLSKLEVSNYVKHKEELFNFAIKNMSDSVALYATSSRWPADAERVSELVETFEANYPNLSVTKRMKERLDLIERTSVGGKVPDIKMRDSEGNEITLYKTKGKYTLIDFWGSWCGPCRRESATLASLYEKYRGAGFQIYGVGLESELGKWRDAMELDKRVWPNVLSLKQLDTEAAYDYGISALPANFLIDADGKIIAKDIHDEELVAKIDELMGR